MGARIFRLLGVLLIIAAIGLIIYTGRTAILKL